MSTTNPNIKSLPKKRNYAFIDSQNLNLGVRSLGWNIDYKKFRLYLKNKYSVDKAYIFIGMVDNNQKLYTMLQTAGYILIFKPTTEYLVNGKTTVKGNVDAELVLHSAAIQYPNYDKAIIVSGDGDFHCLVEYLLEKDKLLKLLTPNKHYSGLLRRFNDHIVRVDLLKDSLALKKTKIRGRSKP
jgi:uncharacterized LabA/DUF88 family protein